jgi:hypothetical protein
MTEHKWFAIFPGSITVAARTEDEAYEYVVANWSLPEILDCCAIEDVTTEVGQEDYLKELDES